MSTPPTARSETRHTEEPWEVDTMDPTYIRVGRSPVTRRFIAITTGGDEEANAARIVACVNGCAGVAEPSVVPDLLAMVRSLSDELREYAPDVRNEQLLTKADALLAKAVAGGVAPGGEGGGNG